MTADDAPWRTVILVSRPGLAPYYTHVPAGTSLLDDEQYVDGPMGEAEARRSCLELHACREVVES